VAPALLDIAAMPPVGVLPVWADLKEFRSCHIVIYQNGCEVKFCDHGLCVASAEMPTVDAALILAESRRPNSGPAPH
jgi:hypothetical protein